MDISHGGLVPQPKELEMIEVKASIEAIAIIVDHRVHSVHMSVVGCYLLEVLPEAFSSHVFA